MWMRSFAKRAAWLMIPLGVASCGSSDPAPSTTAGAVETTASQPLTVDILSYWATPGAAETLQAVINVHKAKHPDDRVINSAQMNMDWEALLADRIAAGTTPDLYVQHSSEVAAFLQKHGADSLRPLDDFLALPGQTSLVANSIPELFEESTVDGKVYAVPAGYVTRANAMYFNLQLFAAHHLTLPTTIDEFRTVCQEFKAAGVSCMTVSFMTMLFEDLLAGTMGIDAYYTYRRTGVVDEAALSKGVDLFAEVLDDYLYPAALQADGTQDAEVKQLMEGKAAMYANGDWMKAGLQQLGWTPGVDFTVLAAPGNAGLFTYAADVFTVPATALHVDGAYSFLSSALSAEGQAAFVGKDATPTRTDQDMAGADSVRQGIVRDWRQAKHRLAANTKFIWEGALQEFAHSPARDKQKLLKFLLSAH